MLDASANPPIEGSAFTRTTCLDSLGQGIDLPHSVAKPSDS